MQTLLGIPCRAAGVRHPDHDARHVEPLLRDLRDHQVGVVTARGSQEDVGTLNSASLSANFTNRTVDAAVNIGINGQTWTGNATSVPIYRDQYFSAYSGAPIAGSPSTTHSPISPISRHSPFRLERNSSPSTVRLHHSSAKDFRFASWDSHDPSPLLPTTHHGKE